RAVAASALHPLVHTNVSDLERQRYESVFSGNESFLADHRVSLDGLDRRVLPAAAFLEMARASVALAVPVAARRGVVELRDTAWIRPLVAHETTRVGIALSATRDGAIDYGVESEGVEHCRGRAEYVDAPPPATLDIATIRA